MKFTVTNVTNETALNTFNTSITPITGAGRRSISTACRRPSTRASTSARRRRRANTRCRASTSSRPASASDPGLRTLRPGAGDPSPGLDGRGLFLSTRRLYCIVLRRSPLPALVACSLVYGGLVTASSCRPAPAEPPPIVLISIDTLRSDRLPAYGYAGGETPAIDGWRATGCCSSGPSATPR